MWQAQGISEWGGSPSALGGGLHAAGRLPTVPGRNLAKARQVRRNHYRTKKFPHLERANDLKQDCDRRCAITLLGVVTPASTQQDEPAAGVELFEKLQSAFAEAYNRKDIAGDAKGWTVIDMKRDWKAIFPVWK